MYNTYPPKNSLDFSQLILSHLFESPVSLFFGNSFAVERLLSNISPRLHHRIKGGKINFCQTKFHSTICDLSVKENIK